MRTHDIGSWPRNATLASSEGRGWKAIQAALVDVNAWHGEISPIGHPCLGYCVSRPAQINRRVTRGGAWEATTLRPRQFHLIPALDASEWRRQGRSDMLTLYLEQDLLDDAARGLCSEHVAQVHIDMPLGASDALLEQVALAILGLLRSPDDSGSRLYAEDLARTAAGHVVRTYTRAGRSSQRARTEEGSPEHSLRRVGALIAEHLAQDLSLESLAREAGLSPRSLLRAFHREFGMSVHQYVIGKRVERARDLLIATNLPITEVALQTGFSSQSHLASTFRKYVGLTPHAFRSARE